MRVRLLQLDGKLPNIALMRIAAHHRERGDEVTFWRAASVQSVERGIFDDHDLTYASLIFQSSRPIAERLLQVEPNAIIGGTGWDDPPRRISSLEAIGITTGEQDYSLYPEFRRGGIGFLLRGCRLRCSFCCVPWKEGRPRLEQTVGGLWRGAPWPKELLLLDNDPFGHPAWRELFEEIRAGGFRVSFSQGINARFLTDETAEAIASIEYRDDDFKRKRLYTAWDNRRDEERLFAGLDLLVKHGVTRDSIMVYVLIGYDHDTRAARPTLTDDDFYRVQRLREFGARPYPMPFVRTREMVGFQRWVIGAYDKPLPSRAAISWTAWERARFQPRRLPPVIPSTPEPRLSTAHRFSASPPWNPPLKN